MRWSFRNKLAWVWVCCCINKKFCKSWTCVCWCRCWSSKVLNVFDMTFSPVVLINFLLFSVRRFLHSYNLFNSSIQLGVPRYRSTLPQRLCLWSLKSLNEDNNVIPDWSLFHNKARIFYTIEIFCDLLPQRTALNRLVLGLLGLTKMISLHNTRSCRGVQFIILKWK